ncbi:MAG: hypothetical protein JWO78_1069 [Micavibrio sp.]|nr:hypothetical protein [Micavibrio sp.]
MVDKRNDTTIPEDDDLHNGESTGAVNLASSVRDTNTIQLTGTRRKNATLDGEKKTDDENKPSDTQRLGSDDHFYEGPEPYESDFSLDQYAKHQKYKAYRDMDDRDREIADSYNSGKNVGNAGRGPGWHADPRTAATIALGAIGAVEIGRRQKEFYNTLPDVEKATGVPARLIGAFWHNESSFGKNLVSPTNCLGDGQFTRGTWAATIRQYGDRIPGMEQMAADLRSGKIKPDNEALQAKRLETKTAAYAMGFYIGELGRDLKVDVKNENNWNLLYAGYNVGPGSVRKLKNNLDNNAPAMELLGSVAQHNPMFFKGGASSAQALSNYDAVIMRSAKAFDTQIVAKLGANDAIAKASASSAADIAIAKASGSSKADVSRDTASIANAVSGPAIKSAANPKEGFSDARHDAAAVAKADQAVAQMSTIDKIKAKLTNFTYGFDDAPKDPAPKLADNKPKVPLHNLVYG